MFRLGSRSYCCITWESSGVSQLLVSWENKIQLLNELLRKPLFCLPTGDVWQSTALDRASSTNAAQAKQLSALFTKQAEVLFHCSTTRQQLCSKIPLCCFLMISKKRVKNKEERVKNPFCLVCFALTLWIETRLHRRACRTEGDWHSQPYSNHNSTNR